MAGHPAVRGAPGPPRRALLVAALLAAAAAAAAAPPPGLCVSPPGSDPQLAATLGDLLAIEANIKNFATNPAQMFTGYWTNFGADPWTVGVSKLSVMRGGLERPGRNLFHSYLPGKLTGNLVSPGDVACPPDAATTRTIDGSCNYPDDPLAGAAGTRMGRNVPLEAARPDAANLLNPNPLLVAAKLLHRKPGARPPRVPFLNLWAAAWVQFMTHDWFVHDGPSNDPDKLITVPMPPEHPLSALGSMSVGPTAADPTRTPEEEEAGLPPTLRNMVTHWWDGSQLYGSDAATAARLREGAGGRMRLDGEGRLPLGQGGFGDAGVQANWWIGLEMIHTLFVKEHNAIAAMLAAKYPDWGDDRLFNTARMVNAAVMAKLHTVEWTPAILPSKTLRYGMQANWRGLISMLPPEDAATVRTLRPGPNPAIYGYPGGPRLDQGVKFSMTEEFTAVYRMHMLIPEKFRLRSLDPGARTEKVSLGSTAFKGARRIMESRTFADLALSFGLENPSTLSLNNYPIFMTNITLPTRPGSLGALDLAAVDIIRDRERGVPRYNAFRRLLQLPPLSSIDDITPQRKARARLNAVYGGDIDAVDLLPGVLAEATRPECFGFGETQFQLFLLMASRRLAADRFFNSNYTAEAYTPEGLKWVDDTRFATVLARHLPELAAAGVTIPYNAFAPWTR